MHRFNGGYGAGQMAESSRSQSSAARAAVNSEVILTEAAGILSRAAQSRMAQASAAGSLGGTTALRSGRLDPLRGASGLGDNDGPAQREGLDRGAREGLDERRADDDTRAADLVDDSIGSEAPGRFETGAELRGQFLDHDVKRVIILGLRADQNELRVGQIGHEFDGRVEEYVRSFFVVERAKEKNALAGGFAGRRFIGLFQKWRGEMDARLADFTFGHEIFPLQPHRCLLGIGDNAGRFAKDES